MYDVNEVIEHYRSKNQCHSDFWNEMVIKRTWSESLLEKFYQEARAVYNIPIDFDGFADRLKQERHQYDYKYWKRNYRKRTSRYYYRQKRGYIKQDFHEKKQLSEKEITRREWRKKVKAPRDQGTRFYSGRYKRLATKAGNRCERRFIKAQIKDLDHDEYFNQPKRHWANPWDWD